MNQMDLENVDNPTLVKHLEAAGGILYEGLDAKATGLETANAYREHKEFVRQVGRRLEMGEEYTQDAKTLASMLSAARWGLMKAAQIAEWGDVWRIVGHIESTMKSKGYCATCGVEHCNEHPQEG